MNQANAQDATAWEKVYFKVEGEFLTDLCRSLILEGRWRDGLATLVSGLRGISTDQALSILKGTHKLAGVNDLDLVEEDRGDVAGQYLQTLAWQFAGLWFRPTMGSWLPYALVGSLGRADVPVGMLSPDPDLGSSESVGLRDLERYSRLRLLYYADDPKHDIATREEIGPVLWKRAEDPPLWLEGSRDSAIAIAEYLMADRRPEERGPSAEESSSLVRMDQAGQCLAGLADVSAEMDSLCGEVKMIGRLGFVGKMAEAAEAILGGGSLGQDLHSKPVPDAELASESGYILPNGAFYGCKYMHHQRLAERLLLWLFEVTVEDPQKEADNRNWLRVQATVTGGFNIMSPKNRPTKRQEVTLASWCIAHQVPYPEDLK